ncbi:MAG: diacylglycerol kinase [Clostridiales bacterium GWC2_40_7]|nr:MAG: diacylglycerol kinase [Clostridiales bacterium GWC2_40_7]
MKNRNLIESFNNAINGVIYSIKAERNMKIHISAAALILLLSLFYDLTRTELLLVCLTIVVVLICELFNTSMEVLVDTIIEIYHPKAKIIKDTAAGAVLISAFFSLIVAYFIFYDRVSTSLEIGIIRIKQAPMHLSIIALIMTIIFVLVFKAYTKRGTPLSGGMPSGHSAIAFSVTTAIALWTENVNITILVLLVTLLVVQSRLEAKIHSVLELLAGAVLGFALTLLLFKVFY